MGVKKRGSVEKARVISRWFGLKDGAERSNIEPGIYDIGWNFAGYTVQKRIFACFGTNKLPARRNFDATRDVIDGLM